jgi:hypothetical protein
MEQTRRRQPRALGTFLPVLQHISQTEDIGLLPYRPTPLASVLSGIARALLPLAMVRQARALEQERQRQQRLAELAPIIAQYPAGQVPEQLWREYTQLAGVEAPPPPEPPEAALRRRLLELEVTRAERFLPYEEEQMKLGIQQIQQGLVKGELDIETAQERLRQMREDWDFVRQFRGLELERLRAENRPLREIAPDLVQRLPKGLRGLADIPMWQLALLNQTGILGIMTDEFFQPASVLLSESQREKLRAQGIDPDEVRLGIALKVMPDVFRATKTVKEAFGNRWNEIIKQDPALELLSDLPATPEILFSLFDLRIKDEQLRKQTARQLYDDILRQLSKAQTDGASPEAIGDLIYRHNQLAQELGLPIIGDEQAKQIISSAVAIWTLKVRKEALNTTKLQVDIQKGLVAMKKMEADAVNNYARTRAYVANVLSQIQHRQATEARLAQKQAFEQAIAIPQLVEQRLQRIMRMEQPVTIQWQGQTFHATFNPKVGWELKRPDGSVIPTRQVNQTVVESLVRQKIRDEILSEIAPPSQQLQQPQRPAPQTPAQRLRGRQPQQQPQRPRVVGIRRE